MTLMPHLGVPEFTPEDMGYALTSRDVGRFEYWGAVAGQSWEESLAGIASRNLPRRLRSDDEWEELYQSRVEAARTVGGEPTEGEIAFLRNQVDTARDRERAQFTPVTAEDWRASESFREGIPYEDGMTVERAAALAEFYDDMSYYDWIRENHDADWISNVGAVVAGIGGGAASPEAFVPVLGPAMRGAAVARLGVVGGRAVTGAVEGAIGTAAVLPAISAQQALIGREFTFEEMLIDVGIGAVAGAALGGFGGALERRAEIRRTALEERARIALTDARAAGEGVASVRLAMGQIEAGRTVDVPPPSRATVDTMLEGLSLAERERFLRARLETSVGQAELEIRRIAADDAGEILLRPETTLTPIEEGAIRGETLAERQRAREVLAAERERRRLSRGEEGTEVPREPDTGTGRQAADEATDVAMRLRELGVAPSRSRRRTTALTPIERMALFDADPQVRELARAELDRRLGENGTSVAPRRSAPRSAQPAERLVTGDAAADIDARSEAVQIAEDHGIRQDGTFAELDEWERLREEATEAELAEYAEAEEMLAKTDRAREAYSIAASCLLRV